MSSKPVIDVARELSEDQDDLLEIEGYTFRVKAMPAAIISDVTERVPDPPVPVCYNKEMERN